MKMTVLKLRGRKIADLWHFHSHWNKVNETLCLKAMQDCQRSLLWTLWLTYFLVLEVLDLSRRSERFLTSKRLEFWQLVVVTYHRTARLMLLALLFSLQLLLLLFGNNILLIRCRGRPVIVVAVNFCGYYNNKQNNFFQPKFERITQPLYWFIHRAMLFGISKYNRVSVHVLSIRPEMNVPGLRFSLSGSPPSHPRQILAPQ